MATTKRNRVKKISTSEGLTFGVMLLAQITGILIVTALAGVAADKLLDITPLGTAAGVLIGGIWATAMVLIKVKKELDG